MNVRDLAGCGAQVRYYAFKHCDQVSWRSYKNCL